MNFSYKLNTCNVRAWLPETMLVFLCHLLAGVSHILNMINKLRNLPAT